MFELSNFDPSQFLAFLAWIPVAITQKPQRFPLRSDQAQAPHGPRIAGWRRRPVPTSSAWRRLSLATTASDRFGAVGYWKSIEIQHIADI